VLLQDPDDLLFRKTIALHALVLVLGQSELQTGLSPRGKVKTDARLSDARLPPAVLYSTRPNARASTGINQPPNANDQAAAAYQKAAEAILRRAPNTRASAVGDELPMTGRIPLLKRRPIER
jgi:hypothetical protein